MTWVYRTALDLDAVNLHLAELEDAGLLGLVELDGGTDAYFPEHVGTLSLAGVWSPVPDVDWSLRWREGLEPVRVGATTIAPPWRARPGDVVIDPGQAFGTGHHETTSACIAALQDHDLTGRTVLDVGTGSGVIAICAARLGAGAVVAVDTDPEAVAAARENAAANGATIDVRLGSLEVAPERYDVVVANLDTATITALAGALCRRLASGGVLVVAGVSVERTAEARAGLEGAGLTCDVGTGKEWTVFVCRPG